MKQTDDLVPIEYVCYKLGISTQAINLWYRWKQREPEAYKNFGHELPEYIQSGPRKKRLWHKADIQKIKEFQKSLPQGRAGILGNVTQIKKRREKEEQENGKKSGKGKRSTTK